MPTKTVIAYEGSRPIFATKELLNWRESLRVLREKIESTPEGQERDALLEKYYFVMCDFR